MQQTKGLDYIDSHRAKEARRVVPHRSTNSSPTNCLWAILGPTRSALLNSMNSAVVNTEVDTKVVDTVVVDTAVVNMAEVNTVRKDMAASENMAARSMRNPVTMAMNMNMDTGMGTGTGTDTKSAVTPVSGTRH